MKFCTLCCYHVQPIIEIEDSEANYEADYLEICVVKMFVFETQEHILK